MGRRVGTVGRIGLATTFAVAVGCHGSQPPADVAAEVALAAAAVAINAAAPHGPANAAPRHEPGCASDPDPCAAPTPPPADDELRQARLQTLFAINRLRADQNRRPLSADDALDEFAEDGSVQLARDHRPHGHLIAHAEGCAPCADVQSDPAGYPGDAEIEAIVSTLAGGAPGSPNRQSLLDDAWHRVGIGIAKPRGRIFVTLDLAP